MIRSARHDPSRDPRQSRIGLDSCVGGTVPIRFGPTSGVESRESRKRPGKTRKADRPSFPVRPVPVSGAPPYQTSRGPENTPLCSPSVWRTTRSGRRPVSRKRHGVPVRTPITRRKGLILPRNGRPVPPYTPRAWRERDITVRTEVEGFHLCNHLGTGREAHRDT